MKDRKLSVAYWLGRKVGETAARVINRFRRSRDDLDVMIDAAMEMVASEAECLPEEEDIPDCEACVHHGHCPWEPQTMYEPPPGFILVRPGPPPHPWSIN